MEHLEKLFEIDNMEKKIIKSIKSISLIKELLEKNQLSVEYILSDFNSLKNEISEKKKKLIKINV